MTRLLARYVLARRGCVVVRQGRYSLYRAYKAAAKSGGRGEEEEEKEGERRRAVSHCADSYFASGRGANGNGRTFTGHGVRCAFY